jgi:hypothetical protein
MKESKRDHVVETLKNLAGHQDQMVQMVEAMKNLAVEVENMPLVDAPGASRAMTSGTGLAREAGLPAQPTRAAAAHLSSSFSSSGHSTVTPQARLSAQALVGHTQEEQLLDAISSATEMTALQVAKVVVGSHASAKDVNPVLYKLQRDRKLRQNGMEGNKPLWRIF